jgi:hypothetical protein
MYAYEYILIDVNVINENNKYLNTHKHASIVTIHICYMYIYQKSYNMQNWLHPHMRICVIVYHVYSEVQTNACTQI